MSTESRSEPASMSTGQLDLFAAAAPPAAFDFRAARRQALDETSWVEHVPGWLTGSQALFDELAACAKWEQRTRFIIDKWVLEPRLTAEYPDVSTAPALLVAVAHALSVHYGVRYDSLWVNLYRDQRDSTAWHSDWPVCTMSDCIVPVLSLGAPRRFMLQRRTGGPSVVLTPRAGDLVVMGGRSQRDWRHSVPKQTPTSGARISVNFQSSEQAPRNDGSEGQPADAMASTMSRSLLKQ